jgi:sulfonate transport system substrate-binding protein
VDLWASQDEQAVAEVLSPQIGLDVPISKVAAHRFAYGIQAISPDVAAQQQKIADVFYDLKLIPKAIRIADALPAGLAAK